MSTPYSNRPTRFGKAALFRICLAFAVICPAGIATAEDTTFYHDAKKGWFWYQDPAPETKEEMKPAPPSRPLPSLTDYSTEKLWNMHPDDFQELLMAFQKKAVQRPTEENVHEYLTMQDIARRKAAAYANVASFVIQKYADLDVGRDYPVAAPGAVAKIKMQKEEIAATIQAASADHALLYFTSQNCPFCLEQSQILRFFTDRYGWQVKEIDIDGSPGMAARFGVQTTPTLLLIGKDKPDYIPVASGVVAMEELERSLYRSVRLLNGQISPQEFSVYDFQKGGGLDPESILKKGL